MLKKILLYVLTAAFLLTGCGTGKLPEGFSQEEVEAEAMKAIGYFNAQDYESLVAMGNKLLQESITTEKFAEVCDPYIEKNGAYKEIVKKVFWGKDAKEGVFGGVVMIGEYEKGKIQFTIGFDEEMKMAQFFIK
ncbi:MAG: DUF3887 domain-containing protein [Peptostreptococcaceae bacterium]|nr:DUF3887 domain-containing protein [Peptostreptococcaceae bacterium]